MWVEYEAWRRYHTPPPEPETVEDAWMAAVARGEADPNDADARRRFVAAWQAAHPTPTAPDAEDWEPVTDPPPKE